VIKSKQRQTGLDEIENDLVLSQSSEEFTLQPFAENPIHFCAAQQPQALKTQPEEFSPLRETPS